MALNDQIRLNQIGFYPSETKKAVVIGENGKGTFSIRNAQTKRKVFSGELSTPRQSDFTDKTTYVMDFTALTTPGEYYLEIPEMGKSYTFSIKDSLLTGLAKAALKGFYYQRAGTFINEEYAGQWHRPMAHPDTKILIHASAATKQKPEGTIIVSRKGWYDAGDYNKYVVNSGFTVSVLHSLFEDYRDYVMQLSVDIPESRKGVPDLLFEVYWNISWMMSMQDQNDGGVYHKLTNPSFEGFIKPIECEKPRYVVAKSVTASLDFAASLAQASRMYAAYPSVFLGIDRTILKYAENAFEWAVKNPDKFYNQKQMNEKYEPAITTGEYGDRNADDEFFWAATELYIVTGKSVYLEAIKKYMLKEFVLPVWSKVSGLGNLAIIRHSDKFEDESIPRLMKEQLMTYVDSTLIGYESSSYAAPFGRSAKDFFWGSNSDAASNQGMALLTAYRLTGDDKYMKAALQTMDYILGRNATGYCYITGFGTKYPMHPHHRLSATDDIAEPIPGLLIGGPNPGKQDGCEYPSDIPDECYVDHQDSYASNEMAINWQGLFTYFVSALDASMDSSVK